MTEYRLLYRGAIIQEYVFLFESASLNEIKDYAKSHSSKRHCPPERYTGETVTKEVLFTPQECKEIDLQNLLTEWGIYK